MGDIPLTLAVAKGKIWDEAVALLGKAGYDIAELASGSRKLIFDLPGGALRAVAVRASDVPTYVQYGAADLGIVGRDTLLESGVDCYEPLDLGIAPCRMSICGLKDARPANGVLRVATKFVNIATDHYRKQGRPIEIIKLYGSVELAPLTGLADKIVDLVQTGETLKKNGLVEEEVMMEVTSRLIVGRAAMKTRREEIRNFIEKMEKALK